MAERDAAEQAADDRWAEWHAAASELAAQHNAIDQPLEEAKAELAQTRAARNKAYRDGQAAEMAATALGPRLGEADHCHKANPQASHLCSAMEPHR